MRVLHVGCVLDPEQRGGEALLQAWPTLLDVAGAVRDAGASVAVLQAAHADELIGADGIAVHMVAERPTSRVPGSHGPAGVLPLRLARRAASLRPDVLHVNGLAFPLHLRALALALPGRPLLAQDHADRPPERWKPLHAWGLRAAAGVAFTAAEQAAPFLRAGLLPPGMPIFELPEASTRFQPGDVAAARAVTAIDGDPAILWVGRLDANKDPLTVLDGFARALPGLPRARLWMCYSDAPLLGEVRARLRADPLLASRVRLLGYVSHAEVERLCRAADFLLLGSRRESTGYAVLEALACGATPIVSDIPAFRALTAGGSAGALFPPGDAGALAHALLRLRGAERVQLRAAARAHFERQLSYAALGPRLLAAYSALLEPSAPRLVEAG